MVTRCRNVTTLNRLFAPGAEDLIHNVSAEGFKDLPLIEWLSNRLRRRTVFDTAFGSSVYRGEVASGSDSAMTADERPINC